MALRNLIFLAPTMVWLLNIPLKVPVLKTWLPACGTVEGSETFRRWGLVEGLKSLGTSPGSKLQDSCTFSSLSSHCDVSSLM